MKQRQAKPVNKAEQLKQVISEGLSILRDGFNVLFASTTEEADELRSKAGAKDLVWLEQKTREAAEKDVKGANLVQPRNSEPSEITEIEVRNEPVIDAQVIEAKELTNRSKQYLEDRIKEFNRQEKIDLQFRNKALLWQRWNKSL